MDQAIHPDDPPAMRVAIKRLMAERIHFERVSPHQLKVEEFNFYPSKGTIFVDEEKKAHRERGLDAFITLVRLRRERDRYGAADPDRISIRLEEPSR